ncbi:MAG: D-glycero-beta-D-manno-heptose-7-phosphate kinase [Rhodospirillaceae bacterium]|nr:D-glycero-beta-D-manno-heptose-7-phosphate kinase [Rhodospirillaceae bacterium]
MTSGPETADSSVLAALVGDFPNRRILCVGDVMVDHSLYGEVKRLSPEAPVPVVRVTRETSELGGAGNVARNIAALGAACAFVSIIGDDRGGQQASELLSRLPRTDPYLRVAKGRETTIKSRFFSNDGHHLLRADRETVMPLTPTDLKDLEHAAAAEVARCDAVILSDYAKGTLTTGPLDKNLGAAVIAAARALGKPVIVDPKGTGYERYRGATIITPNRAELADATGMPVDSDAAIVAAGQALRGHTGAEAILVTRSGEGMSLIAPHGVHHLPAENREVADVTGAGDTVIAVFSLAVAGGASLVAAARLANIAAGIVVGRQGTAVATASDLAAALLQSGLAGAEGKVVDRATASSRAAEWRRQGLKVGFTNGCFDLLHPGHISLLRQARGACDRLVVGLNSDGSVRRLKGETRPVQNESARATVMASLASVDLVVIFAEDTPAELIKQVHPDVLVKGADYTRDKVVGGDFVESYGGRVILADVVPSFSTTATIASLKKPG